MANQDITILITLICKTGNGSDRVALLDTVTQATRVPGISIVVLLQVLRQIHYERLVLRHIQTYVPTETTCRTDNVSVDVAFPTPSLERTNVHIVEYETGCIRHTETIYDLIIAEVPVVSEVEVDAVIYETTLNTYLIRSIHLRNQCLVRTGEAILITTAPQLSCLQCGVNRQRACVLTYLCVRTTQLQVVQPLRLVKTLDLGEDERTLDCGIEVRVVLLRQSRRPVVTSTQSDVSHLVVTELNLTRDSLQAASGHSLLRSDGRRSTVVERQKVDHEEVRAIRRQTVGLLMNLVITNLCRERELIIKPAVLITCQNVHIHVVQVILRDVIVTVIIVVLRSLVVGTIVGVLSNYVVRSREVPTERSTNERILNRCNNSSQVSHCTVRLIIVLVLVHCEQGVQLVVIDVVVGKTHMHTVLSQPLAHIVNRRPQVSIADGAIQTTSNLRIRRLDVSNRTIEVQPLINLSLTTDTDSHTTQVGSLDNTLGVQELSRCAERHLVLTCLYRNVVAVRETGLQHSRYIVVDLNILRIQTTKTSLVIVVGSTVSTVSILVLNLRPAVCLREREVVAIRYRTLTVGVSALLGGDDNCTIRSVRTVKCSSGSTFQDGHRLDIIGVKVITTRREVHITYRNCICNSKTILRAERRVVHRNTVDNVQRLVATRQRSHTTQYNLSRSTGHTRSRRNGHTCYTTLQCRYEIGTTRLDDVLSLNVLNRRTYGTSYTLHTELSRYNNVLDLVNIFKKRNLHSLSGLYLLSLITDVRNHEGCAFGHCQLERTTETGCDRVVRTLLLNGSTNDTFTGLVHNST